MKIHFYGMARFIFSIWAERGRLESTSGRVVRWNLPIKRRKSGESIWFSIGNRVYETIQLSSSIFFGDSRLFYPLIQLQRRQTLFHRVFRRENSSGRKPRKRHSWIYEPWKIQWQPVRKHNIIFFSGHRRVSNGSATQKWLNQSSWDWIGAMYVFPFWLSPVDHPTLSHANEKEPKPRRFLGLTFFLFVGELWLRGAER